MAINLNVTRADSSEYDAELLLGVKGDTGKSAYQYAVDGGYEGTETDFLNEMARLTTAADEAEQSAEDAEAALNEFVTVTATAETLPAGSDATATYLEGELTFGIPKGDKGDKGDTYDDSAIVARMDSFTNLAEGSTTGDAELIDGRVGADGVTYTNIGGAIRGQVTDLKSELAMLEVPVKITSATYAQGNINSSTGDIASSTTRCRSSFIQIDPNCEYLEIDVPLGKKLWIYRYTTASVSDYAGAYTSSWQTGTVKIRSYKGQYIKLIIAFSDDSTITPSDLTGLAVYNVFGTDESLTQIRKAADSKVVGDRFGIVETDSAKIKTILSKMATKEDSNGIWERGGVAAKTGEKTSNFARIRTHSFINISFKIEVKIPSGMKVFAARYSNADYSSFIGATDWAEESVSYDFVNEYIILVAAYVGDGDILAEAGDLIMRTLFIADRPIDASWGEVNTLARVKHITDIKWTPVGNMPKAEGGYFDISEQTGLPYSSVRDQDKAVGMDVSIHTFMTAVRDPNSVLYKRRSTVSNSSSYYGTVCSGLLNYAYGIELDLTNFFLGEWDGFVDVPMIDIKAGDMIWITGHCAMITNVIKDNFGRIKQVTVTEEWPSLPRSITYNWSNFLSARDGYIARRYKAVNGVPYTPIPYVQCFDEAASTIKYPDVQTEFGDAAVFMLGDDVNINVINGTGYSKISITLNEEVIYETTEIADFTYHPASGGLYTITAHGSSDTNSTFYVVDATASFNDETGEVTFSSANATPALVNVYNLPVNRNITCKPIILTDEDRSNGRINVLDYMDNDYKYAKVTFVTQYGTAVWYSETHEKWQPI